MRSLFKTFAMMTTPVALAMTLAACGGDGGNDVVVTPTPTPAPVPGPTSYDVTPCLTQQVSALSFDGYNGDMPSVADLVIPDTLTIDFDEPSGFPNGRELADPVIDIILASIFLDLTDRAQGPLTFLNIPLNPPQNDQNGGAFRTQFPYLLPPQDNPPIASSSGSNFTFADPDDPGFVRVERFAFPGLSTALVGSDRQVEFNEASVEDDPSFAPELVEQLEIYHQILADDFEDLGLTACAEVSGN